MNVKQNFEQFAENTIHDADLKFKFPHIYGIENRLDFLRAIYKLHYEASH